jgi:hypothetical protein
MTQFLLASEMPHAPISPGFIHSIHGFASSLLAGLP